MTELVTKIKPRPRLRVPQLTVTWEPRWQMFAGSLWAVMKGPKAPKEFRGDPYFRDCYVKRPFPKGAMLASSLWYVLLFLIPIPGTPLANRSHLGPIQCLKILALFRFLNPTPEIRIAGGREVQLGWLQPLGLEIANSIFIGDYLTTKGQPPEADFAMIRDLGFSIVGDDAR